MVKDFPSTVYSYSAGKGTSCYCC